jgi:hypothetical protein
MTYTRETLRTERRLKIEGEIAFHERKIRNFYKEIASPRDPIRAVFGGFIHDGSQEDPLEPLCGTSLGEAIKAAIVLANEARPVQWLTFNEQVFNVNRGEDLKGVSRRVEYVRKTLFPTKEEWLAGR